MKQPSQTMVKYTGQEYKKYLRTATYEKHSRYNKEFLNKLHD